MMIGLSPLFLMRYSFSEDQIVKITLSGEDLFGNKLESPIYTFTTKNYQVGPVDDYGHVFTMYLKSGLNMISLPLKPETPYNARTFAEKLSALM